MANIAEIYNEATQTLSPEQELEVAKQVVNKQESDESLKIMRTNWLSLRLSKELLSHLEAKELQLRQEAATIAATGNPNDNLIRAKIVESLALAKVAALVHGIIEKL